MQFWQFMFVPTILFLVIVAPIWIVMHYQSVKRSSRSLSSEDRESIEHMLETVDRLGERIATLESILESRYLRVLTSRSTFDYFIDRGRHGARRHPRRRGVRSEDRPERPARRHPHR